MLYFFKVENQFFTGKKETLRKNLISTEEHFKIYCFEGCTALSQW